MTRLLFVFWAALLVAAGMPSGHGFRGTDKNMKSAVFLSPKLDLGPGSVINAIYRDVDFPKGHIGIKSFDAELVDEAGNPVPLQETYLHHWVIQPYYVRKGLKLSDQESVRSLQSQAGDDYIPIENGGLCQNTLRHFYGLGSETRRTSTYVPDPYAIEIGNPEEMPDGYEINWVLNVHAIDTRGVEDRLGCIECRCDLYNVTKDEFGQSIAPDYVGGFLCCYDKTQCRVKHGVDMGQRRSLYLRYTVRWVDWDISVHPVTIYILDITDTWARSEFVTGIKNEHYCHVEYNVKSCKSNRVGDGDECVNTRRTDFIMPVNGYIVYGVSHQHAGGIGAALYRENGHSMCSSIPIYGKGDQPGDEAGYIVGMSTCYPEQLKVTYGERLVFESNYSSAIDHTGVMSLFYIMVAQQLPLRLKSSANHIPANTVISGLTVSLPVVAVVCGMLAMAVIAAVAYRRQNRKQEDYVSLGI